MTTVELRPPGVEIKVLTGNAYQVTFTFPNGYTMGAQVDWAAWVGDTPQGAHLADLVVTLANQVITVTISAVASAALADRLANLYVSQLGEILIDNKLVVSDVGGEANSSSDVTVTLANALNVAVSIASLVQTGTGGGGAVASVNGHTGVVVLNSGDVGAVPLTQRGAANGVATLDGSTTVPDAQIPAAIARDSEVTAAVAAEAAARTAAINAAVAALVNSAPGILDTLGEIAAALQADESTAATLAATVAGKVDKSLYDANTILAATVDDTPFALSVPASTIVGRKAAGGIVAMTTAELKTLLALVSTDLSDFTEAAQDAIGTLIAAGAGIAVSYNDAGNVETISVLPGLNLTPTAVKTGNYTAVVGDFVPVDTTAGAVTVTLPTAPVDGATIGIKVVTLGAGNFVTIAHGGTDVFNVAGGSTTLVLHLLRESVVLQYKASTGIWYVVAADKFQVKASTDLTATGTPDATKFLRGDDTWAVPPSGGAAWGFRSGLYYSAPMIDNGPSASAVNLTQNKLEYVHFIVGASTQFTKISINVQALAAGSSIRLGIYSSGVDGYPNTLVLDAGTVSSATTGVKEIVIAQTLAAGIYWLACVAQSGSPNVIGRQIPNPRLIGQASIPGSYNAAGLQDSATVAGALPASSTTPSASNTGPVIWMLVA